jgi:redox-sensitive bicupin YhaK (pirin superfamily)
MTTNNAATLPRKVVRIINGMPTTDGAGVELVRVIGQPSLMELDPFLLLDAFRSENPKDYIAGFPSHPHRGFETVTYLLNGRMRHKDNAGNEGVIAAGSVQWMTAGKGIIHSEMPEQENGLLEGFQLWINLPASHKMTAPQYQEHNNDSIPTEDRDNETLAPEHNAFIYVIRGGVSLLDEHNESVLIGRDQLAVLSKGATLTLKANEQAAQFLLIAGRPLNEPISRSGPFVMNTDNEIRQAIHDYQKGQL